MQVMHGGRIMFSAFISDLIMEWKNDHHLRKAATYQSALNSIPQEIDV